MRLNVNLEFKPPHCPAVGMAPTCQRCEHFGGIEWTEFGEEVICYWTPAATEVSAKDAICTVVPAGRCSEANVAGCLGCKHFTAVVRGRAGNPVILCKHKGE